MDSVYPMISYLNMTPNVLFLFEMRYYEPYNEVNERSMGSPCDKDTIPVLEFLWRNTKEGILLLYFSVLFNRPSCQLDLVFYILFAVFGGNTTFLVSNPGADWFDIN